MSNWSQYHPIPAESLPARFEGVFKLLELTFTPPNDRTIVRTLTGQSLELVCEGDDDGRRVKTPVWHAGYQKAIWELREGHLRYCPSQDRLWRRDGDDGDHPGDRRILNSWHPIKTIEDEYAVGTTNSRDRNPSISAAILREAKRPQWFRQVERGVRIDPCVWIRRDGRVVCLRDETDLAVTQTFDPKGMGNAAIQQAIRICQWLTVDEKSARNLLRMFATPWLEPFKQLTYILSGHGGDGKTLVASQALYGVLGSNRVFPGFSVAQYCSRGGYTLGRESMNDMMDGKAFAYDDEASAVSEDMLPQLRALSTGSQMQARVTGGRYRTVTPTATIVLLTNMPFADSTENSDRRRFVKVEMHPSQGRTYDEYHAIELFCRNHPAAFYAASCRLWEQGDEPEVVNLSPARTLSDETYWIVSEIIANEQKYGQPIAARDGYRDEFHHSMPDDLLSLLGLRNGTTVVFGNGAKRVVRVSDRDRFDVYRRMVASETDDTSDMERARSEALAMSTPASLLPIERYETCAENAKLVEQLLDGMCGFAMCEGKRKGDVFDEKVSLSWRRLNRVMEHHAGADTVRLDQSRYAVVPLGDVFVIDCDTPKKDGEPAEGEPHGFQILQQALGEYGGDGLRSTLAVRSPHGLHLYYRAPSGYDVRLLKNSVHPDDLPIDLRVSGKGYVLGPWSHANGGDYRLVDLPDGDVIPEASPQLMAWLRSHDYTEQPNVAQRPLTPFDLPNESPRRHGNGKPDMTPVPEGQRNQTLHDWAYGRAANHRDNWPQIERDLYERGHASGLKDQELETIWKSIMRQLGGLR